MVTATVRELHAEGISMAVVTNNVAEFGGRDGEGMPANVEAARRIGMHGVLVEADPTPAMAEVRRLVRDLS